MAVGSLSPVAIQQFFDANGDPLAGGSLGLYLAGTSTPSPAYADQGLTIPLANPYVLDVAGRAPELFLDALSYKQVLKNALGTTIWTADNVRSAGLLAQMVAAPVPVTVSATGTAHNVDSGTAHVRLLNCVNVSDLTITGVTAGVDGDVLLIVANGTGHVFLNHQDGGSAIGNQLRNFVSSGPSPLAAGYGIAQYQYLASLQKWRLVNHEQGRSINVAYAAGNYFSQPAGTWTVPVGSVTTQTYYLSGAQLTMTVTIGPNTIAGTPVSLITGGWPYRFARQIRVPFTSSANPQPTSQWSPCFGVVDQGNPFLYFILLTFGTWADTGANYVWGQMQAEVQ